MNENPRKCERCGETNPVGMKFCGMCGAQLPQPAEADDFVVQQVPRISEVVEPDTAPGQGQPTGPAPTSAPAYTGGAFRLMGQEVDPGKRSLDYLLEDDEDARSGGARWVVAILLALVLAGGLGYWRYRNGGWMAKRSQASVAGPDAAAADNAGGNGNTVSAPASGNAESAANNSAPPAAALTDVRPQTPPTAPASAPEAPSAGAAPATEPPATKAAQPQPALAKPRAAVPRAEAAVKAEDPIAQGEKYIYGRGVPQNCDRGVKLVRPAADAANSKAMITMGALYATGLCVSRDLPTAYKFFALALRKDPENVALKQNVERVWGQMTQLERQEAIRLTQ